MDYEQIALDIIGILEGRKGFNWWWHDIGIENNEEIIQEIVARLRKANGLE